MKTKVKLNTTQANIDKLISVSANVKSKKEDTEITSEFTVESELTNLNWTRSDIKLFY